MYTVNIDAGGSMTDGLVLGKGHTLTFKIDSTPHDLTVSILSPAFPTQDMVGNIFVVDPYGAGHKKFLSCLLC